MLSGRPIIARGGGAPLMALHSNDDTIDVATVQLLWQRCSHCGNGAIYVANGAVTVTTVQLLWQR